MPKESNFTIEGVNEYVCLQLNDEEPNFGIAMHDIPSLNVETGNGVCFERSQDELEFAIEGKALIFVNISALRGVLTVS